MEIRKVNFIDLGDPMGRIVINKRYESCIYLEIVCPSMANSDGRIIPPGDITIFGKEKLQALRDFIIQSLKDLEEIQKIEPEDGPPF